MIRLVATSRRARAHSDEPITTGSVGMPISVTLSEDFDGLQSVLVCKAGSVSRDLAIMGGELVVPHECLTATDFTLLVGVYAKNQDGTIAIPTVWAKAGDIVPGTEPSEVSPSDPTPSWAAQVQEWAEDAHDTAERLAEEVDGWETQIDAAVQGAGNVDATASKVGDTATITVTDRDGVGHTVTVRDGAQGEAGQDGYSPSAKVLQGDGSATITITDKDGTTIAAVYNGADGRDGADGVDGYSPTATVTQTATGATISVTDKSGTTTASVSNGADGTDGADGFSPTVDVQPITGGHEVTITDADGAHSFEVLDGDPATPGSITDAMLAPDGIKAQVKSMWGNRLTGELTGEVLTASDAYTAPPLALGVDGKSEQDGTPTPDAPVDIVSAENPVLTFAGKNLFDIDGAWISSSYGGQWRVPTYGAPGNLVTKVDNGVTVDPHSGNYGLYISLGHFPAGTYSVSLTKPTNAPATLYSYPTEPAYGTHSGLENIGVVAAASAATGAMTFTLEDDTWLLIGSYVNSSATLGLYDIQIEAGSTATPYTPYVDPTTVTLPVTLRSLPNGTKDTLALTYLRPSTREGWAWYSGEVTQNVMRSELTAEDITSTTLGGDPNSRGIYNSTLQVTTAKFNELFENDGATYNNYVRIALSNVGVSTYSAFAGVTEVGIAALTTNHRTYLRTSAATDESFIDALFADGPIVMLYAAGTPIITTLDPIELPSVIGPSCTIWATADATPELQVTYERDVTIAYNNLLAAYADLATS